MSETLDKLGQAKFERAQTDRTANTTKLKQSEQPIWGAEERTTKETDTLHTPLLLGRSGRMQPNVKSAAPPPQQRGLMHMGTKSTRSDQGNHHSGPDTEELEDNQNQK